MMGYDHRLLIWLVLMILAVMLLACYDDPYPLDLNHPSYAPVPTPAPTVPVDSGCLPVGPYWK